MAHHSLFRDHILLLLLCSLLFFPFLGNSVLWDFDEGYFAAVAREMFDKGEWIVPTFRDSELGDKPILIFWGMILSFWVFGINEFAVRFPSALYGTMTVLLTYHLARRLFRDPIIGLRSALILATMLLYVVQVRGTTCDGAMICWLIAALTVYVYGCRGFQSDFVETPTDSLADRLAPWFPDRWYVVVLMNACLGMAVLAKGPAMAVLGTSIIGLFLLVKAFPGHVNRNPLQWIGTFLSICWKMRPLTAILTVFAVAAPWFIAVGWKTNGEWLHMFFIEHHFQRSIEPTRGHTGFGLGPLFYPVMTLFGTFPWSIFFLPWLIDLCRRFRRRGNEPQNAYCFTICWIALYFGLFTLVSTKLPHYVAPAYPAIAILLGVHLTHWRRGSDLAKPFWTWVVLGVMIVVGVGIMVTMFAVLPRYFPNEQATGIIIGLVPLLLGIAGIVAYLRGGRKSLDVVYILLPLLFVPVLFQWGAGQISKHAFHRSSFFQHIAPGENGVPPLVVGVGITPSWVFYSGQPLRKIDFETLKQCENESELRSKLIEIDNGRPKYLLETKDRRLNEGQLYLIISESDYETIRSQTNHGKNLKEIERVRRFMRNYNQLLLRWEL